MKDLTPAVWDFLGDVACQNLDLARTLRDEIIAGTFVALDGEPCLCDVVGLPDPGPSHEAYEQLRLGGEAA